MDELEALKVISQRLESLAADERTRVIAWINAKYAGAVVAAPMPSATPAAGNLAKVGTKSGSVAKAVKKSKSKSIIALDKALNLSPSGKKSAAEFATEKKPSNVKQKCVVAVYYLRDVIELEKISVSAVYTVFKALGWVVPADLRNTLQQAGSEGWLDTSDADDIKLTSMGENLIEHSLPPKQA